MDAKTLDALKASIAKWERNARARSWKTFKIGTKECALCALFHPRTRGQDFSAGCPSCPVQVKTGHGCCEGTPYDGVHEAHMEWEYAFDTYDAAAAGRFARKIAREEVAFLRSLLPEGETA